MIRRKSKFRLLAKGKRNRICLRNGITIKLTVSETKDAKEVVVYPNYAIINKKVQEKSLLPNSSTKTFHNQEPKTGQPKDFKIKFSPATRQMTEPLRTIIQETSKSVVQVHCVEYWLTEKPELNDKTIQYSNEPIFSGTGVIVNFDDQCAIISALHVIQPKAAQSVREVIITVSDDDMYESVKQWFDAFSVTRTQNQSFHDFLSKYAVSHQWFPCEIDREFVAFRRRWLEEIANNKTYTKVIDPKSKLKPSPSFDLVFLKISNDTSSALWQLQFQPIALNTSSHKLSDNQALYLIGYNTSSGYFNLHDLEYAKTFQIQGKQKIKYCDDPENLPVDKDSFGIFTYLSNFVNMKKSVSLGVCEGHGNELLRFKATSTQGSSGGPVLDENGRLVGIAFGNFSDHESQEDPIPPDLIEDESFDIRVPGENYEIVESRNYNLAISVTHFGIQDFLKLKRTENLTRSREPSDASQISTSSSIANKMSSLTLNDYQGPDPRLQSSFSNPQTNLLSMQIQSQLYRQMLPCFLSQFFGLISSQMYTQLYPQMFQPINQPMPQQMPQPMPQSMSQPMYPPLGPQASLPPQQNFTPIAFQGVEGQQLFAKQQQEIASQIFVQENPIRDSSSLNYDYLTTLINDEYKSSQIISPNLTAEPKKLPQNAMREERKKKTSKSQQDKKENADPKPKRKSRIQKNFNETYSKEKKDNNDDVEDVCGFYDDTTKKLKKD